MSAVPVDTSVLVSCLRDRTQTSASRLAHELGERDLGVTTLIAAELLAGADTDVDWQKLNGFIALQTMILTDADEWLDAAKIYFDCRRAGKTVRKLADCFIAAVALKHSIPLIHNDHDFEVIAQVRPLQHIRLDLLKASP